MSAATPSEPALLTRHLVGGDLVASLPLHTGRLRPALRHARWAVAVRAHEVERTRAELAHRVSRLFNAILTQRAHCEALVGADTPCRNILPSCGIW
ncbi:MAG: hypothetical protein Q8O14_03400 [bacterium]|nr:hypothetical protein [bacterium]